MEFLVKYLVFIALLMISACGKSHKEYAQIGTILSDIYGGSPVKSGEWQNVVAFTHLDNKDQLEKSFCSGTLISPSQVLTAAHCLKHYIKGNYQDIVVTPDNYGSSKPVFRRIEKIKLHPFYHPLNENSPYDFAIVELYSPISSDLNFTAIAMSDILQENSEVLLVGFGDTDNHLRGIKHQVTTNVRSSSELEFVAGGNGKDTCGGDSGGPVFTKNSQDEYVLIGITSRSSEDANAYCGDKTIYGKAHLASRWIRAERLLEKSYKMEAFNAIKLIEEALTLLKGFPDALMAKALVLKEIWRFDESLLALQEILSFDPENLKAYIHKADIYQKLSKPLLEIEALKKVLILNSQDAIAYNRLIELKKIDEANIYKAIGLFKENKIDEAKDILKIYPENQDSLFIQSFMFARDGLSQNALEILSQVEEVDSFIINLKDKQGDNFLLSSAYDGNLDLTIKLVNLGASLDARDNYGNNVTHLAWWRKNLEVLDFLLSKGAHWDINRVYSQFLYFISKEDLKMVSFLIDHGIKIECDAINLANQSQNEEIKNLLINGNLDCSEN